MSTQSFSFSAIPFTHAQPQQAFRLLELPQELLELLSAEHAPTLYLKSSNTSTSSTPASSATTPRTKGAELGYVHLCTPTQTYQVRQVSTSNSLFVTQPTKFLPRKSLVKGQNDETDTTPPDEVALFATGALTAIGQVSSVLELKAVQLDVWALLKGLVPVWQWNDIMMPDNQKKAGVTMSKRELFDQIPAPENQIEHAWRELFAFQLQGRGYVPAQDTLYYAWTQVMDKFNMDGGFRLRLGPEDFLEAASEDDFNDGESELLDLVRSAIWRSPVLRKPADIAIQQNDIGELDRAITTAWVGRLVLQYMSKDGKAVDAGQFISKWRNLLPEKWSSDLGFDLLNQGSYRLEVGADGVKSIRWAGEGSGRETNGAAKEKDGLGSLARDTKPAAEAVGKRKWHEKFKDSRNVKK